MTIYLRRKKDNNKAGYILETKVIHEGKQRTIYLTTLPPLEEVLEWVSGKASKDFVEEKIQNSLKASVEIKRQEIKVEKESEEETKGRLIKIKRTDANQEESELIEPTEEEILKSLEESKEKGYVDSDQLELE